MKKKKIAAMLVPVLLAGIATACSSGEKAGQTPDPVTSDSGAAKPKSSVFTWLVADRVEGPVRQDWEVFKELEKKTGAKIEFQAVPAASFAEKQKILIATNSVTDLMLVSNQEGREYGQEKIFLNLKDYLDQAPNIKKFFDSNPEAKAQATAADGGLYTIPQLDSYIGGKGFNQAWYVRQDLMDKYGLKAPTTLDELYQLLKAFKQQNPDSYPLTLTPPESGEMGVYGVFMKAFTGIQGYINLNPENDQFAFTGNQKGFKEALQFMNKLYSEKLLDPEYSLLTRAQYDERLISSKSFVTYYWKADVELLQSKARTASGNQQFNLDGFLPVTAPGVKNYLFSRPVVGSLGMAVSAKVKDKQAAVKLIDYLVGEEGKKLLNLGIEGKTYKMVDGKPHFMEEFGTAPYNTLRRDYGVWYPMIGFDFALPRLAWESALDEKTKKINAAYEPLVISAPRSYVKTKEEQEMEKSKLNNLTKYLDQRMAEFVMGKTPINDEKINDLIEQSKKLGLDDIVNMYNTAYKRTYGSK